MPTYTWRCEHCDDTVDQFMTIRVYIENPPTYYHCGHPMQRKVLPVMLGPISERHYDGLRATDGTDISTRAKHRAYMKANNLTTIDDFASTWKRDAEARAQRLDGVDPERKHDIARAIEQLGG